MRKLAARRFIRLSIFNRNRGRLRFTPGYCQHGEESSKEGQDWMDKFHLGILPHRFAAGVGHCGWIAATTISDPAIDKHLQTGGSRFAVTRLPPRAFQGPGIEIYSENIAVC